MWSLCQTCWTLNTNWMQDLYKIIDLQPRKKLSRCWLHCAYSGPVASGCWAWNAPVGRPRSLCLGGEDAASRPQGKMQQQKEQQPQWYRELLNVVPRWVGIVENSFGARDFLVFMIPHDMWNIVKPQPFYGSNMFQSCGSIPSIPHDSMHRWFHHVSSQPWYHGFGTGAV